MAQAPVWTLNPPPDAAPGRIAEAAAATRELVALDLDEATGTRERATAKAEQVAAMRLGNIAAVMSRPPRPVLAVSTILP